ncbi:MAG: restriction endonuclease subunit S [Chloroflexi bacterium]|nr:restriction endonuclease subunit S [Chloroflexota bacterium]
MLRDDFIFEGEYVLISEDGENLRTRKTPIAFKANGKFWVNNHAHILKCYEEHMNNLLIYYFQSLDLHEFITGAVQPKLNKSRLCVPFPFLPTNVAEQKRIAAVLSSLDDKIDLLHRQNSNARGHGRGSLPPLVHRTSPTRLGGEAPPVKLLIF